MPIARVAGAVGVTVLGTYTVMHGGKLGPILDHPLPGDNYHGEGHGEEHEEAEGEEEGEEGGGEEQSEGGGDGEGEGEDSTQSSDSNEKDDSQSEQLGAGTAESVVEELSEGEESGEEGQKGVGVGKLAEATELERGPQGQRRFLIPSAKGGNMRRIESPKGIVQGRAEGQTEGGSIGDVKDGSKSAVAGQTSRAQKGISNTDTKHSTDLMADPEKSKKSEGVPETAKIQVSFTLMRPSMSLY